MKAILNIALVAHDSRKNELLDWVRFNAGIANVMAIIMAAITLFIVFII